MFDQQLPATPIQVIKNTFSDRLPRFSLPLGEDSVKWTVWLSEEALASRVNTLSQIAVLKGKEREDWTDLRVYGALLDAWTAGRLD